MVCPRVLLIGSNSMFSWRRESRLEALDAPVPLFSPLNGVHCVVTPIEDGFFNDIMTLPSLPIGLAIGRPLMQIACLFRFDCCAIFLSRGSVI